MTRRTARFRRLILVALPLALLAALVIWHDVPADLTAGDREYAPLILANAGYSFTEGSKPADFEGEVRAVLAVQDAVLTLAPQDQPIPFYASREPKDLYELRHGLCFDRSRVIEKLLAWLGFETRHVSIYATNKRSAIMALLTPRTPSHALSEVRTKKGWMAVDSNRRWIGLDAKRNVVSISALQGRGAKKKWAPDSREAMHKIFRGPFVHIRGLYSRHGHFYPPYTPLPDYSLGQLASHIWD